MRCTFGAGVAPSPGRAGRAPRCWISAIVPPGSLTTSSARSSTTRAAAISSSAAVWRCSPNSPTFSSSTLGLLTEADLEAIADHAGRGDGAAAEGVGQHDGPTVRPDAHEELAVVAAHIEIVAVDERQLERHHAPLAALVHADRLAPMEHPGGLPGA